MPFIAKNESDTAVTPSDFKSKFNRESTLYCPFCNGEVGYRKESSDGRRAHFWHIDSNSENNSVGGCSIGGESEEHELMKKKAIELQNYSGNIVVEKMVGDRIADVLLIFPSETPNGIKGVVIEVQYKNKNKNYIDVTRNFIKNGYAIHWVFADYDELERVEDKLSEFVNGTVLFGKIDPVPKIKSTDSIGDAIQPSKFDTDIETDVGGVYYKEDGIRNLWEQWEAGHGEIPYGAMIYVAKSHRLLSPDEVPKYKGDLLPPEVYDSVLLILNHGYEIEHGRERIRPNSNEPEELATPIIRQLQNNQSNDDGIFLKLLKMLKIK